MRTYQMEERNKEAKYYYLYKKLKNDILCGNFQKGEKLPSKRSFAEHLGVSLITVENAYQLLKDEGYIETRERSGYYVCEIGAKDYVRVNEERLCLLPEKLGERGSALDSEWDSSALFPTSVYFKTIRNTISEYGEALLEKTPSEGCAILRNSIAQYLLRYRGVFAQPSQIIIGSGAEHLYGVVVRLLGNDNVFALEDPSYEQIQKVYEGMGVCCELLPMGEDGIKAEALQWTQADVLHVTPFHSYPSGVTASIGKRYEYLEWAATHKKAGVACNRNERRYIIEDDFDSEFFMPGKPINTLFMLDTNQTVIYINTFSKSLSPAMRMGYMILPEHLLERYEECFGGLSCTVPVLEQYALAEFINKGYFEQHLNRVRRKKMK